MGEAGRRTGGRLGSRDRGGALFGILLTGNVNTAQPALAAWADLHPRLPSPFCSTSEDLKEEGPPWQGHLPGE